MFGKIFGGGSKDKKTSSSSKTSAKSSSGKKKNDDLAALGIDPSLLEDPLDDDAAMDDADMDVDVDAILNEINAPKKQPAKGGASKGGSASNTPKSSKQGQVDVSVNINIDINALGNEDDEPEVQLTDEDMKDPSLLAQLLELGVEGIDQDPELAALMNQTPVEPEEEVELELDDEDLKDPTLLKEFKSIGGSWTDPKTKRSRSQMTNLILSGQQQTKLLEHRIKEYKDAAVKSKKDNCIDQAKEYLRIYKSLEQTLESVKAGAEIDDSKIPAPPKQTQPAQPKPAEPKPAPQPAKATQQAAAPPQATKDQPPPQSKPAEIKPAPQPAKATVHPSPQPTPQAPAKATQATPQTKTEPIQTTPSKATPPSQPAPTKVTAQPVPAKAVQPSPQASAKATTQPTPQAKVELAKDSIGDVIQDRIAEYKAAALTQKKAGNLQLAKDYLTAMKKCQALQEKHQRGEPVAVSQLPPSIQSQSQSAPTKQIQAAPAKAVAPASTKATPQSTPQAKAPAQAAPKNEAEEDDPNPVENMISNDVLEWALQDVNAQIAKHKGKGVPEELADRKQAIEMQIQILTVKVSSGALDQDQYLNNMRAKIDQERQLAKKYVGQGKRDWAALALKRAKIMEEEIKMTLEE